MSLPQLASPPLSLALHGLTPAGPAGPTLREQIPWARATGFAAVQPGATAAGVRPRELDRSARRDVAAIIRREGLNLSGLDLWIPAEHFTDLAHLDRAMAAMLGAIELAAELSLLVRGALSGTFTLPVVSTMLPDEISREALTTLAAAADRAGVRIVDHAIPARPTDPAIEPAIGIGVDPAAALAAGLDPASLVSSLGKRLASARFSDVSRTVGGGRVIPGSREGRLDLLAYSVALATSEFAGHIIADLRSLPQPEAAAAQMLDAWRQSATV